MNLTFLPFRFALLLLTLVSAQLASGAPQRLRQPPLSPNAPPIAAGNFTIAGTVVNAVTGEPLARARITLADTRESHQPLRIITDDGGHFAFIRIPAGKFNLAGAKRGFVQAAYEQHEQFSTAIVTGAGLETQDLTLRLTPLAFISGKVLDESGEPVRAANVVLYRRFTTAGAVHIRRVSNDTTDDQGYYEFPAVPPDEYFISASAKPWYTFHQAAVTEQGPAPPSSSPHPLDVAYPVTFYNGATESDGATPIKLTGGDRLQIDLRLNPVPSLHLVYRVPKPPEGADAVGFSIPNLQKRIFDSIEGVQAESRCMNDVCEISGVPAGHYTVTQFEGAKFARTSEMDLAQNGQEFDVNHGELSAQVTVHAKLPADNDPPQQIFIGLQSHNQRQIHAQNSLNASGDVTFPSVPTGDYSIVVWGTNKPYAVTRVRIGDMETAGPQLKVPSGGSVEATASISAGIISIEGFVKRGTKPASGIMVALVPQNHPEENLQFFRRDQSDLDGSFILRGVIPGSYTLIAVEDAWGFEWLQPGVLSRYLPHGQNVNITEHMHGSVLLPDPVQVLPR